MNIVEQIFQRAERSAPALICGDQTLTYGELIDLVEREAARMARVAATRMGLDCPNGIAHVILALAIVRAGKCLVPLAAELAPGERARLVHDTGIQAIVTGDGTIQEMPCEALEFDPILLEALNPAFIRFSSGTTGKSKGVVLSHESLMDRIAAANHGLKITPADRIVWTLPMAHHFAVSIMLYLAHGAATIVENSHLAEDILTSARIHGGTVIYGSPFHHALLAAESSSRAWSTLRLAVSTAAALPRATAAAFLGRFGVPLTQGLGIIEIGLPMLNLDSAREKPVAIGRPLPGFQARIEEDGALLLRGPGMFDAYLRPWRLRDEVLENGWFRTGDLARCDCDGDYFLEGRSHSVINVAGLKCFPEEIEAVIAEYPGVRAVRVSGRSHEKFGAVPVAEIVPADPAAPLKLSALLAHCRTRLARYKTPVEVRWVESIPLTPSGKIQR